MQKHERMCLEAARDEAAKVSGDLTVTPEHQHGHHPKMRLILKGPRGARLRTLACSPRSRDEGVIQVRQWVRRVSKEII